MYKHRNLKRIEYQLELSGEANSGWAVSMAFVFRTNRETCRGIAGYVPDKGAPTDLGPGHYDVSSSLAMLDEHSKSRSQAPFLSTSHRDGPAKRDKRPDPGQYYNPTSTDRSNAGCEGVFKSQTDRFEDRSLNRSANMPAPGQYEVKSDWNNRQSNRSKSAPQHQPPGVVLEAFQHIPTVPSIPSRDASQGYVVDNNGKLRPRRRSASSNPPTECATTRSQGERCRVPGAVSFDKQASRSVGERPNAVPGPGSYYINTANDTTPGHLLNPTLADLIRPQMQASFASGTKRNIGAPKAAAQVPGPGQYPLQDLASKAWIKGSTSVPSKGFGSTAARFTGKVDRHEDIGGGPDYIAPRSSFLDTWRPSGVAKPDVGFNSSAKRMSSKRIESTGPGIGEYHVPGMADELLLNMSMRPKQRQAPFGSSSRRFRASTHPSKASKTQDAEYNLRMKTIERRKKAREPATKAYPPERQAYASVFKSKTERWKGTAKSSGPDPGTYEPAEGFASIVTKKHANARGFMETSGDRFRSHNAKDLDAPGPGYYYKDTMQSPSEATQYPHSTYAPASIWQRQSSAMEMSKRAGSWKRNKNSAPGPGQYHSNDAVSSLLKPTYNLSIAVEEEHALRRLGFLPQ